MENKQNNEKKKNKTPSAQALMWLGEVGTYKSVMAAWGVKPLYAAARIRIDLAKLKEFGPDATIRVLNNGFKTKRTSPDLEVLVQLESAEGEKFKGEKIGAIWDAYLDGTRRGLIRLSAEELPSDATGEFELINPIKTFRKSEVDKQLEEAPF